MLYFDISKKDYRIFLPIASVSLSPYTFFIMKYHITPTITRFQVVIGISKIPCINGSVRIIQSQIHAAMSSLYMNFHVKPPWGFLCAERTTIIFNHRDHPPLGVSSETTVVQMLQSDCSDCSNSKNRNSCWCKSFLSEVFFHKTLLLHFSLSE